MLKTLIYKNFHYLLILFNNNKYNFRLYIYFLLHFKYLNNHKIWNKNNLINLMSKLENL